MDFKNAINEIGEMNIGDKEKVIKVKEYINHKYSENSRPVKATHAKKQLLKNNQISEGEAENIKYEEITKKLREKTEERLEKQEVKEISKEYYEKLLSYKNSDNEELFIYLLLVSGLRINELYKNSFKIEKGKLIIDKLSKRRDDKKDFEIKLILIKPREFIKLLNQFRSKNVLSQDSLSRKLNRRLAHIGLSLHNLRGIYLYYHIKILKTNDKKPIHIITRDLLHHQEYGSGVHYNNKFKVSGMELNLSIMKVSELKKEAKARGLKGYSKKKRTELIEMLK